MSNVKKAGVAAPAMSTATNEATEVTTMNNVIVELRKAFDKGDIAPFVGAHHVQVKKALPTEEQRAMLYAAWSRSEFEPPKWLEKYEAAVKKTTAKIEEAKASRGSQLRRLVETTPQIGEYKPLLLGKKSLAQWAEELREIQTVINKDGREVSAIYSELSKAQFAMTKIAMAAAAAANLGVVTPTEAGKLTSDVYERLEELLVRFASKRGHDHRELVVANVTLNTQHGMLSSEDLMEEEGELKGWERLQTEEGFDISSEHYEEEQRDQELEEIARENGRLVRNDKVSEDEGRLQVALHEFQQLLELSPGDVEYDEGAYAQVMFMNMDWPKNNPLWHDLVVRLGEAWATSIGWTDTLEEEELLIQKTKRRARTVEDFHAAPFMTRWVLNHVTRRVWRDIQIIRRKRDQHEERIEEAARKQYLAERYHVPNGVGRRRDEGLDNLRVANLFYLEVREADLANNFMPYEGSAHEADLAFWGEVVEQANNLLPRLVQLWEELREMEASTTLLWGLFPSGPKEPPLYWNNRGFYMTQEDAEAALEVELHEQKLKLRAAEGDAFAETAAEIGENFGLNI